MLCLAFIMTLLALMDYNPATQSVFPIKPSSFLDLTCSQFSPSGIGSAIYCAAFGQFWIIIEPFLYSLSGLKSLFQLCLPWICFSIVHNLNAAVSYLHSVWYQCTYILLNLVSFNLQLGRVHHDNTLMFSVSLFVLSHMLSSLLCLSSCSYELFQV